MPKSNTRKLNDTQLIILSSASQREDGLAVLPKGVRAASLKAAVIRLIKLGFLKQVRVKRDQPHWFSPTIPRTLAHQRWLPPELSRADDGRARLDAQELLRPIRARRSASASRRSH